MGKAVAIPPDKEAEKKEMFKVNHDMTHCVSYIHYVKNIHNLSCSLENKNPGEPVQSDGQ